ncbi:MAG: hypothetical protein A2864_01305 [Candidatus Woykebacteria bacterium RIFCSPHIGHO2_01_FULL_39_12]|uniref:CYTH domain-containing protein n=1 Tax=Candidatus Woykebacteria bacterium RIFCSPHIGHO2_01_FULL_39_12 TaxID=1802599 RepID=A0A1G1WJ11_9BACT|nr:MAG: hypothetical protein A2864_01305 [Candidatus Woykebacteria bacterium RIFCSPHIGHO2_01_FULL_39_12]
MIREIERKFLIEPKRLPKLSRGANIIQGYLSASPEVRVRIQGKASTLTIKTVGIISREEFEYKIPLSDAKKLMKLTDLKVEKARSFLKLGNDNWIIDFYKGANKGLVTAEIELKSEDGQVEKPLWAVKEITEDLRYRNQSLAKKPFSEWR